MKDKLTDWLVEQAKSSENKLKEGRIDVPSGAHILGNKDEAFVRGMIYAWRELLGEIASGKFEGNR